MCMRESKHVDIKMFINTNDEKHVDMIYFKHCTMGLYITQKQIV